MPFVNLKYVHVIINTHSAFVYALAQTADQATQATKTLKTAILVMEIPWAIKADNGWVYASGTLKDFFQYWKIKLSAEIPYTAQGQAIVERTNCFLKGELAKVPSEHKKGSHQDLV